MYILFIGDETVNSATISSQATASQISGHPASFAIKYSQMIGSASLVLLTFVIYNLLQFIL